MKNIEYIGNELELFENAENWKNYWSQSVLPYIKGDVLEVGAGIGGTTSILLKMDHISWTCIEPDKKLAVQLEKKKNDGLLSERITVITGTIEDIPQEQKFDCILYIDVIEHIENDKNELTIAARHLKETGTLFILTPAHNWLYSPFDKSVGHFRRYNKTTLQQCTPENLEVIKIKYLDSVGLFASLVNKIFLKQSNPSIKQIYFWDKFIIPLSKIFDTIMNYNIGKTVTGIWRKNNGI